MAHTITEDFITLTATGDEIDAGVVLIKTDSGDSSGPIQLQTGDNNAGPTGSLQLKVGQADSLDSRGAISVENPYVIDYYPFGQLEPVGEQLYARKLQTSNDSLSQIWSVYNLEDSVMSVDAKIVARQSNGNCAVYKLSRVIKDVGGSVSSSSLSKSVELEDVSGWDCDLDENSGEIRIRVQGATSATINWYVSVRVIYNAL